MSPTPQGCHRSAVPTNQGRYDAFASRLETYIRTQSQSLTPSDPVEIVTWVTTTRKLRTPRLRYSKIPQVDVGPSSRCVGILRLLGEHQRGTGTGGDHGGRILDGPSPTHVQVDATYIIVSYSIIISSPPFSFNSPLPFFTNSAHVGYTLLYKLIHTVSIWFIGPSKCALKYPCVPRLSLM